MTLYSKPLNIEGIDSIEISIEKMSHLNGLISSIDLTFGDVDTIIEMTLNLSNGKSIVLHPKLNIDEIQELFDTTKSWTKEEILDWLMVSEL
jgi:hypothetical protein